MGLRKNVWSWVKTALGPTVLGREFERLYYLYELLHRSPFVAWCVLSYRHAAIGINCFSENSIDGSKVGPLGVTPDQMTDEVWDYILAGGTWPEPAPLVREKADAMKHEFEYFYPFDIRSSGKDLVPNHLTFCVYVHAAIFPEDKWPLSMRTNGHLMLNGKKMSKSTGNSLTMRESIEKFGADATRLSLADAGDSVEDANFDEKTANANILRVHTLLEWCEVRRRGPPSFKWLSYVFIPQEMTKGQSSLRQGPLSYHDNIFEEEINDLINITKGHYET